MALSFTKRLRPALRPTQLSGALPSEIKLPGREISNLSPSRAEFMKEWIYSSALPLCLSGVNKDNCVFLYRFIDVQQIFVLNFITGLQIYKLNLQIRLTIRYFSCKRLSNVLYSALS